MLQIVLQSVHEKKLSEYQNKAKNTNKNLTDIQDKTNEKASCVLQAKEIKREAKMEERNS